MVEIMSQDKETKLLVVGVGGAGNNAVNRMIEKGIKGVDLKCVNTDNQQLQNCKTQTNIQIGEKLTHGQGAGAQPQVGEKAAEESKDELLNAISGYDMVFVTCGMGGGTGTGAAPVIAKLAKDAGALTVAVVSLPFTFEGKKRWTNAESGLSKLVENVDTLLVVPNDNILKITTKKTGVKEAFKMADEILVQSVAGITDIITTEGLINVDFADVTTIMKNKGLAHIGIGEANGDSKCQDALEKAISSPLLDTSIEGASDILVNYYGTDLGMQEVEEATEILRNTVSEDANIIFGISEPIDGTQSDDKVKVIVIATGLTAESQEAGMGQSEYNNKKPAPRDRVEAPVSKERDSAASSSVSSTLNNVQARRTSFSSRSRRDEVKEEEDDYDLPNPSANGNDINIPTFLRGKRK